MNDGVEFVQGDFREPEVFEVLLALEFARPGLKPNGAVLIKTFQGAGFQQLVESARQSFKVRFAKPGASRARSSELYLLASGFRMV